MVVVAGDHNTVEGDDFGNKTVHYWDANITIDIGDAKDSNSGHEIKDFYHLLLEGDERYTYLLDYFDLDEFDV